MLYIEYISLWYSLQSIRNTLSLSGKMLGFLLFNWSPVARRKRFQANELGFKALDLGSRAS